MKLLTRHQNNFIYVTLFFLGFFIYFLFIVDPPLYLLKNYREFFTDIYFFKKYFNFPGNPTEYVSRLITQFYNIPVLASFTITIILYSIYWLGYSLFGKEKHNMLMPFIPVIILITMHNDYNHSLKFDIEILLTLFISCIYYRVIKDKGSYRFLFFPVLLVLLYYLTGIKTVYLFTLMAFFSELFSKERKYFSVIILLETLAVTLIFNHLFFISYKDVFKELKAIQNIYALWFLPFLLYLSVLLIFTLYTCVKFNRLTILRPKEKAENRKLFLGYKSLLILLVITFLTACICYVTLNKEQKIKLLVQYYGRNKDWNKVLELSKKSDFFDRTEIIYTNRALYFTGRIYEDLFKFNQDMASNGLLATKLTSFDELVPDQEMYLDLGALSLSIIWGTEATNVYGANPYVLKNLTKAFLAQGCIKESQKMLNLIDHTLFNKKWVQQYRKFVNDTSLINTDPELGMYRKNQVHDAIISKTAIDYNLYLLTGKSGSNKMAYNYLMISSMLDNNMTDFAVGLSGLKLFGYTHIPRLYFEGFVYYSLISEKSPINIDEFTFDRGIIDEFKAFQKDYVRLRGNPEEAKRYLFSRYGDTYWYYLKFPRPVANEAGIDVKEKERE
ncbi:MAG: DUF6057 family protein [Bacteroidales bacterium]